MLDYCAFQSRFEDSGDGNAGGMGRSTAGICLWGTLGN
jgi:hypothetical protein